MICTICESEFDCNKEEKEKQEEQLFKEWAGQV